MGYKPPRKLSRKSGESVDNVAGFGVVGVAHKISRAYRMNSVQLLQPLGLHQSALVLVPTTQHCQPKKERRKIKDQLQGNKLNDYTRN